MEPLPEVQRRERSRRDAETTVFVRAASVGDAATVERMIAEGFHPDSRNSNGSAALHLAVAKGMRAVSELLLNNGASVHVAEREDVGGFTPLHYAVQSNDLELARLLLRAGADPSAVDSTMRSPLMLAAKHGLVEMAKFLISRGADVNQRDQHGFNASFIAREYRHEAILKLPGMPPPATASIEEKFEAFQRQQEASVALDKLLAPKKPKKKGGKKKGGKKKK